MTENKRFIVVIDSNNQKSLWDNERIEEEPLLCLNRFDEIDGIGECCELLNNLTKENEELKQRNDRQAKQLDRLYCLIEEKDWRTLNDILDDFKRCEEQLQREWGTYGDVE